MVSDEELEKIKIRANKAVEDQMGHGHYLSEITITLAMDPVVTFAIVVELQRLRRLQRSIKDASNER